MHKSSPSTCWEYKLVSMGNPLEPDTELRANTVGKLRWELTAIDAGVWVFKRPLVDESATGLQAIMEETVPITEPETVTAVSLGGLRAPSSGASYPTSRRKG
ncbi:MAG TPA: hypothetical protein VKV73_33645 [Chloroflexota bacterium]|nr:hypothetical protein [Chloroflexota bacterium]